MASLTAARDDGAALSQLRRPAPVMTIGEEGLVLGGTVLAPLRRDAFGLAELVVAGAEERILALLAIAYGKDVGPDVLSNIRWAAREWRRGQSCLAQIHLAYSGLPRLADLEEASSRLFLGEKLLAAGVPPRGLMKACGLDPTPLDLLKAGYDPNQPRVPAGNPDGGQWTDGDAASGGAGSGSSTPPRDQPSSAAGAILVDYKVIKEPPKDAKVVIPPDGAPIRGGDPPTLLIAPRHADYRQVYAAGQAIASMPPLDQIVHIRAALHQGGTYDFQRDPIRQETRPAYANASNYAVGVYLAGAGYALSTTRRMAEAYAYLNSSNYGDKNQIGWIEQAWRDATAGRWK
jgi:hypothetical protein